MESAIEIGSLWERDDKRYMVTNVDQPTARFTVKDADAANWQPALAYQGVDGDEHATRVRTIADFRAKFTPVG